MKKSNKMIKFYSILQGLSLVLSKSKNFFLKIAFFSFFCIPLSFAEPTSTSLYPNEQIMNFANAETLTYFVKGNPEKPLIIFIPGDSHLARIAYGYPQGKKTDFLAYWLNKKGYSFLGLSYPLNNPVYQNKYPDFNIQQWGEQIIQTAKFFIKKNNLSNKILILGWSMGGSVEQAVNQAAQKHGLQVEVFIGLAAVPPLPYIMQSGPFDTNIIRKDKLADRSKLVRWFNQQLDLQNKLNNHIIIPQKLYESQFIGDIPAAIAAEGYYLAKDKFIKDTQKTYEDSGVFNFANTPWIALIVDDAVEDSKISLIDTYSWNFIRAEMLYKNYLKYWLKTKQWPEIKKIFNEIPTELTATVHGTHFFFVGEQGARATADQIEKLTNKVKYYKSILQRTNSH